MSEFMEYAMMAGFFWIAGFLSGRSSSLNLVGGIKYLPPGRYITVSQPAFRPGLGNVAIVCGEVSGTEFTVHSWYALPNYWEKRQKWWGAWYPHALEAENP